MSRLIEGLNRIDGALRMLLGERPVEIRVKQLEDVIDELWEERQAEVERYRQALVAALAAWIFRNRNRPAAEAEIGSLLEELNRLAENGLTDAYRLGSGIQKIGGGDAVSVADQVSRNAVFLAGSLQPYLGTELLAGGSLSLGELAEEREEAWASRIGLYAGVFWTTMLIGFGSRFSHQEVPVARRLDPRAEHCGTCPPKAREYASWDEMLIVCGGLPGDGSDACFSNCRCTIDALIDGVWVPSF